MARADRTLAIVERAYRGSAETQFADVLYLLRELNRQLGGVDVALRGLGATYALAAGEAPSMRVGERELATLPDPRRSLATLLDEGVAVLVEEPDLAALGATTDRVLPGVQCLPAGEVTALWPEYRAVWFA
jgi:hypothetical protein